MSKINTASTVFHSSKFLAEEELLPPGKACCFCGGTEYICVGNIQHNPDVELQLCKNCNAASASRMPAEETLTDYYRNYYNKSASGDGDDLANHITFEKPKRLAKMLAKSFLCSCGCLPEVRICDFGGGDGFISSLCAQYLLKGGVGKVAITIVDYTDKRVNTPDERITLNKLDTIEQAADKFDFIIASAIIEHYPEAGSLLMSLLDSLAVNGIFYARTPYMYPFVQFFDKLGKKLDITYPGHVHDLGQYFWEWYFNNRVLGDFAVIRSCPSIVETTLATNFVRTIIATCLKAPWYVFGEYYKFVGGWEIMAQKKS